MRAQVVQVGTLIAALDVKLELGCSPRRAIFVGSGMG